MIPDLSFRISVIEAGLRLKTHLAAYPDISVSDAIRQLRNGPLYRSGLDYDMAVAIAEQHGFSVFQSSDDRREELRDTIFRMATLLRPFWAKIAPMGRERVRAVLSADQIQCLRYADLLDSTDEAAWRWWDALAAQFRSEQNNRHLEIGREGELLSLAVERAALVHLNIDKAPRWMAIEDNLAGFDILSFRKADTGLHDVFIEVKATSVPDRVYTITRREWNTAIANRNAFVFHFWYLPMKLLFVASVEDLEPHIPLDHGHGQWQQVQVALTNDNFEYPQLILNGWQSAPRQNLNDQ